MFSFFETLLISLPRSEVFSGFNFNLKNNNEKNYSTKLKNLFIFYTLESDILPTIKTLDITFNFNTYDNIEKCFFFTHHKIPIVTFMK